MVRGQGEKVEQWIKILIRRLKGEANNEKLPRVLEEVVSQLMSKSRSYYFISA